MELYLCKVPVKSDARVLMRKDFSPTVIQATERPGCYPIGVVTDMLNGKCDSMTPSCTEIADFIVLRSCMNLHLEQSESTNSIRDSAVQDAKQRLMMNNV